MAMVSVIIPTYNRALFLAEAMQSVIDQTFKDFELLVVDDGSVDNTREMVMSINDPRIKYLRQENRGVAAARNTGIKASGGKYIAFLDSDDIWLSQSLELKVKALDSRPELGLVCSDAYIVDNRTGDILGHLWYGKPYNYFVDPERAAAYPLKEMLARGCFIMPQATVVRRTVFAQTGFFDESLRSGEDWDMFVRIVQRFPIDTIDLPLVKIRRHDESLSGSWDKWYQADVAVANKAIHSYSLSHADLKLVKRRLARHHFLYGRNAIINGRISEGRKALFASIRVMPWSWGLKSMPYLALSIIGNRGIVSLKSLKKGMSNYPRQMLYTRR